jgi:hypothetical protein
MQYVALVMQCCPSKVCAIPHLNPVKWQQFVMFHEAVMAVHQIADAV